MSSANPNTAIKKADQSRLSESSMAQIPAGNQDEEFVTSDSSNEVETEGEAETAKAGEKGKEGEQEVIVMERSNSEDPLAMEETSSGEDGMEIEIESGEEALLEDESE